MKRLTLIVLLTLLACLPCWGQIVYDPKWYDSADGTYLYPQNNSNIKVYDNGNFSVSPDTDATVYLGRAAIGSPTSDYAVFSHYDRTASTGYAIQQTSGGITYIGGSSLYYGLNGAIVGAWTSTGSVFGSTSPWSKLSVDGGDISVRDVTDLAGESLTNGALTGGASWTQTNDCALAADAATWTYSAGTASTLTQASATLAIAGKANRWYYLTYTVSGVSGTPTASITTAFASATTALTITNGAKTLTFKSAAVPGDFVITSTLTAGQAFTIDTMVLKEIIGGDVEAGGSLIANTLTNQGGATNIVIKPAGTGITVIGDAGAANRVTAANDNLYVSGQLEVDGTSYFDGSVSAQTVTLSAYSQYSTGSSYFDMRSLSQQITIAAGASTATTTTLSIPVRSTITGFVAKVTQAPGGGPTNFRVGIHGGDADCLIDDKPVTVNGTFDAWEDGDGTYTFFIPVPTSGGALTFDVTVNDGASPVAVTGASFVLRLVAFYQTRTPPSS